MEKERLEGEAGLDLDQKNSSAIYPDAKVRIEKAQYSILHLQHLLCNRGELIINPDFQRNQVWNNKQSSELIESILMGIPIPMMYLFETKEGKKQVVDGRQRITAIVDFLNEKYRLKDLKILHQLNGNHFSELESKLQGIFEVYQLSFYIIQPPTPERVKYDIFDRVNRGGTRLNNQEMRNALYQGKATELIDSICGSSEFKTTTNDGVSPKRMRDKYIVLRAIAFYWLYAGKLKEADAGKPVEYKSDIDDFLAKVMTFINQSKEPDELENTKSIFLNALSRINQLLGKDSFRFESASKYHRPINMPLFECLIYLFLFDWKVKDEESVRLKIHTMKLEFDKSGCFNGNVDSTNSVNYRYTSINRLISELKNKQ